MVTRRKCLYCYQGHKYNLKDIAICDVVFLFWKPCKPQNLYQFNQSDQDLDIGLDIDLHAVALAIYAVYVVLGYLSC